MSEEMKTPEASPEFDLESFAKEVAEIREQRQQQQAMQEQLAQASQVAEGAGKAAPMVQALGGVDAFPVQ